MGFGVVLLVGEGMMDGGVFICLEIQSSSSMLVRFIRRMIIRSWFLLYVTRKYGFMFFQ